MLMQDTPTQLPQTQQEYIKIYQRRLKKCAREHRVDPARITAQQYVTWLISQKMMLSKASWRLYKAASLYALKQNQEADTAAKEGERDEAMNFAILELTAEPQTGASTKGKSGPSLKKKSVKEDILEEILAHLEMPGRSIWNKRTAIFIRATIRVGVRPGEWGAATLTPPYLVIQNAKATNGRASGKERWIPYTGEGWHEWLTERATSSLNYTEEERAQFYIAREKAPASLFQSAEDEVESQLREISLWKSDNPDKEFNKYVSMISLSIDRAFESLRPKTKDGKRREGKGAEGNSKMHRPMSLYTLRHQFIANMKNVLPDVGVSELSGHGSVKTAKKTYSKANQGHGDYKAAGSDIREGKDTTPAFRKDLPSNNNPSAE